MRIAVLIFACGLSVNAQVTLEPYIAIKAPCSLSLPEAPVIRGLKLGAVRTPTRRNKHLSGVQAIHTSYYNDRLFTFTIQYDKAIQWTNAHEFLGQLTSKLNLPSTNWRVDQTGYEAALWCEGFQVNIDALNNRITLTDLAAARLRREQQRLYLQRKKEIFQP